MLRRLILASMTAALPASFLAPAIAQETGLQPADIFELEAVASPQISPAGDLIAYTRRSNDIASDQTLSAIWLINPDGSDHRALVDTPEASSNQPVFSPNGRQLAYLVTIDGETSLNIMDFDSGETRDLGSIAGGVSNLQFSPDGTRLAFASFIPGEAPEPAALPDYENTEDWAAPAIVETRLVYRIDGIGGLPHGAQQIFVLDIATGEREQVTSGTVGAGADFSWGANGQSFLVSSDRRPEAATAAPDAEIFRVDASDGSYTQLTDRRGPDNSPLAAPDGSAIAYLGFDDQRMGYHNTGLYLMNPDGSAPRRLTGEFDRSVSGPVWADDASGLYFQYDDHGQTIIAFVDLDGTITPLVSGLGGAAFGRPYTGGSFDIDRNGQIAFTRITAQRPAELAVGHPDTGFSTLTALNEDVLADRHISEAEEIVWTSPHDGQEIQGWALYPPNYDPEQQYPLILEIHGGPFAAYGPVFTGELQLMAAAGYVVVYTNPRGSTSYGYDFANEIHHAYPGNDHYDLMGAMDLMVERGIADPNRLFITGGSGGGTLTAWAIGQTNRFAAAAVVKPVINWSSFVLHADLPQFFYRYWFPAAPWEAPDHYWQRSPLSLVGNVETPTLMMVGGADIRTPVSETEQYYSALRLRDVPSELVIIPDASHGIANSRPSRLLTKVAEILRWFEAYDPGAEE